MSKSKKEKPKAQIASFLKDAVNARLDDQDSLEALPALMECLLPVYDGKELVRQPGRMTIRPEGPCWLITLDCPTEVLQARFSAASLVNAFLDLNSAINDGHLVWLPGWSKTKKKLPTIDELIQ